jgi:hypothetical protein
MSDISCRRQILYYRSLIFVHIPPYVFLIFIPSTMFLAIFYTFMIRSVATTDITPPRALQKASSNVASYLIK